MRELTVTLEQNSYPIQIGCGLLHTLGDRITGQRALIVTDGNVAPLYLQKVSASLSGREVCHLILPPGEGTKSLACLSRIYDALADNRFSRTDAIVALGGGVIGDLAGFAAATFMRGVPYVQVPTTLLSQVDSAVGGKVAIDLPQGKNLAGAFYQPRFVLIDLQTLHTLPDAVFRDGLGEVVKYACIDDPALFSLLERSPTRDALMAHMEDIVTLCLSHKKAYVEQDERDLGVRMALNFGHTIGHAIEAAQRYEGLRHGEAVCVGMNLITRLSEQKGLTEKGTALRLEALLKSLSLPTAAHINEDLAARIMLDKKNLHGAITCVLLKSIGSHFLYETALDFFKEAAPWLN